MLATSARLLQLLWLLQTRPRLARSRAGRAPGGETADGAPEGEGGRLGHRGLPGHRPRHRPGHARGDPGAARDHERLLFKYRSHDGEVSRRIVEPHHLVHTGRRWYLVAFDVDRDDWRTFRVDRIEPKPSTD